MWEISLCGGRTDALISDYCEDKTPAHRLKFSSESLVTLGRLFLARRGRRMCIITYLFMYRSDDISQNTFLQAQFSFSRSRIERSKARRVMKDEGVTESQVYSHESPASRRSQVGEKNSRDLILFTFPIFLSSLLSDFSLEVFRFVAGNLKPHREGKKQINLFSIHNAHCLIELDPIRSPKKRHEKLWNHFFLFSLSVTWDSNPYSFFLLLFDYCEVINYNNLLPSNEQIVINWWKQ